MRIPRERLPDKFEYKYFTRRADGSRRWEAGANRVACPADKPLPRVWDERWEKVCLQFSIYYPAPEEAVMHVTGDLPQIGAWFKPGPTRMQLGPVEMLETDVKGRKWKLSVWHAPQVPSFSYRYILVNTQTKHELWEREPNRRAPFEQDTPLVNSERVLRDVNFVSDLLFDEVPPSMFIGPYPQSVHDIDTMARAGVTAVFNVQTDEDFQHRAIQWPLLLERYAQHDIKVVRHQIRDFDRDSLRARLKSATRALERLINEGRKVYIHCTAGMGRAPACAVSYLCWVKGMDLEDAVTFVKKHRTVAVPNVPVLRDALKEPYGQR
ncbi:Laforin [Gracilaria domingensis]|nr:Laforin [Gracilaria domingensis]